MEQTLPGLGLQCCTLSGKQFNRDSDGISPSLLRTIAYDPYYKLNNMDCNDIVGSCNGLICLRGYSWTTKYEKAWFRLWNPATKKLSEMLGDITERLRFAFGYDNLTDTYKVVAFSANKVTIFSFSDNVQRDI
jgi:hypothetical protein